MDITNAASVDKAFTTALNAAAKVDRGIVGIARETEAVTVNLLESAHMTITVTDTLLGYDVILAEDGITGDEIGHWTEITAYELARLIRNLSEDAAELVYG